MIKPHIAVNHSQGELLKFEKSTGMIGRLCGLNHLQIWLITLTR